MENYQKICVTGFIHKDGKVLIIRRARNENFLSGYYELPGGKVEFAEDVKIALVREIKEETNLKIDPLDPYHVFSYVSENGHRHSVDIAFIVELAGSDHIELSKAHDDFIWINESEIENYLITDQMKESILKGFKNI